MKAELVTITPAWARRTLDEKNAGNRAMNLAHVEALAKEMRNGLWKVNGDTICLNGSRLIDGQHRLAAVVASGVTIQSFVVDGVPSDVFDTKDIGKRRSCGDTLTSLGEKNAYRMAAALALVDKYITGRPDKSVTYKNSEMALLLEKYPEIRESIQTSYDTKCLIPGSLLDACHYLFSRKDRALADKFVEKLLRGTGLEEGEPAYVLRERLMRNSISKAKLSKTYIMALCVKAWNAMRSGARVCSLRWCEEGDRVEPFPVVK